MDGMTTGGVALPALVAAATVGLWAFALLPEFLVALLFFAAATILRLASPDVVFSGFASSAFWLVLSGFVLGGAIRKVGLADRVAGLMAPRLVGSWPALVAGVIGLTYALAFVMPSNMGRIAVLMPVVMALADRAGLPAAGPGRTGLALAVGFGTFQLSASILPANVPNLVMAGAAESAFGLHFAYLPYLALHAPVLGLLKGAVLVACIALLFRPGPLVPQAAAPAPAAMTPEERRLAALLLVTLALWMTDSLHGIPAAWIGLAAACLCLLPRIGFLSGEEFASGVNIRTCLYIAGILGLAAVVTRTGLGDRVGRALLAVLPLDPARPTLGFASLVGLTTLLNFAVTANGVSALFTPLARLLAEGTGLPLVTVLMVQVIGYSTPLLPYQAAPIVVAMGMGRVPARDGARLCLAVAAVTFAVLVPLDVLWFRLLGRL
ncbi:SLC13 family permease [uncultured Methylobacterium sp.]|jgi:di/tricarboxylate transporter|uniref:SLC13 family permease n=1 Tax=uncultured Methylobacterium sp. TaxID=157278 RepID=UPI0026379EF2|nr:SLC13 family permease [uncultured Methylobacterium sp.]